MQSLFPNTRKRKRSNNLQCYRFLGSLWNVQEWARTHSPFLLRNAIEVNPVIQYPIVCLTKAIMQCLKNEVHNNKTWLPVTSDKHWHAISYRITNQDHSTLMHNYFIIHRKFTFYCVMVWLNSKLAGEGWLSIQGCCMKTNTKSYSK
jgi:hypothetical protein